jgi:hypothetical protein
MIWRLESSNRTWKDGYVFVCGDNWERLPREEASGGFTRVRRSWGTLSSSGVCFFFLTVPFICYQLVTHPSFCSFGSSVAEFCVEGEDIKNFGD